MFAIRLLSVVLYILSGPAWAQSVGEPLPGSFASGERSEVRPVDPEAAGKPWDPSLSEIDRIDASIRLRAVTGQDKRDCHYGPVERRISKERLQSFFDEVQGLPPAEQFQELLNEPEDTNAPPRSIMILAPFTDPLPKRLVCPKGDVTAQLLERRRELLRQGQVPTQAPKAPPSSVESDTSPAQDPERPLGSRLIVKHYDPSISELDRTEAIMRNRAATGLDRLTDCYYGPVQLRIPLGVVVKFLNENPELDGEQYWRWVNEQTQDPDTSPLTILVRSGTRPDCPAGDIDERLRGRRAELIEERKQ